MAIQSASVGGQDLPVRMDVIRVAYPIMIPPQRGISMSAQAIGLG
jgi:hypothetical protein